MTGRFVGLAAALVMASVALAGADEHAGKPLVACDKIVETYKKNQSVDETASALMVDQSRVSECLKGTGITAPAEDDE
jgi:hypothetical protein